MKNLKPIYLQHHFLWLYSLCALFIALNICLLAHNVWWLTLLPLVLIAVLLLFFSLDSLLLLTVFCTPLSVMMAQSDFGTSLSIPAEPLMLAITGLFLFRQFYEGGFDKRALFHPLSILIIVNIVWMAITVITSDMPLVSAKYLAARLWFVVPFYFVCLQVFRNFNLIKKFIWLYIIPLLFVIIYTTYELWQAGFDEKLSQSVMTPFYPSHTSYGAVIAMFLPFVISMIFTKNTSLPARIASLLILISFCLAILFSYSRAVWISLPCAAGLYLVILFKIKLRTIALMAGITTAIVLINKDDILMTLEKNKQDSSKEFAENFESFSNITTDQSNTERLNRWNAAFFMFKERPVFGWGPGTYQFEYAPFQKAKDLTLISTNAGNLGNAHSEYIGPLAEGGLLGSLTMIFIIGYAIYLGVKLCTSSINKEARTMALVVLLGLVTYFAHGFLNNYLDTDKASVPFWGFIAILTALDVYHSRASF